MYSRSMFLILLLSVNEIQLFEFGDKKSENYGPYDLQVYHVEQCTGPRPQTIATYEVKLYPHVLEYNITFSEQARFDEARTTVSSIVENRKNVLYNLRIKQPCQHFVLGNVIDKFFNAKNCVVQKGNYFLSINHMELARTYFGPSFFYGDYVFKTTLFASKKNVMCAILKVKFTKK